MHARAAKIAGYGIKPSSIASMGAQLVAKPAIIAALKEEKLKRQPELLLADGDDVLTAARVP